jgi:hypothetical protein
VAQQPFGGQDIGAITVEVQQVARLPGEDRVLAAQEATQIRDMGLQSVHGRVRGRLTPHHLHQPVGADHLSVLQRQRRQYRLPPQPAHRTRSPIRRDIDWSEQPYVHPHAE